MSRSERSRAFHRECEAIVDEYHDRRHPSLIASIEAERDFLDIIDGRQAEALKRHRERQVERLAAAADHSDQVIRSRVRQLAGHPPITLDAVTEDRYADLLCRVPLFDFEKLFSIRDMLPAWYAKRLDWVNGQINWTTSRGKPAYFNKINAAGIPVADRMAILAGIHDVENDDGEGDWVMPILTCGLFPREKGKRRYVKHCHELDWCPKCTWANVNNGIDKLRRGYNHRAFARGVHYFAITIAPRLRKTGAGRRAAAVGGPLTAADWDILNPGSVVFGEAHQPKVFMYPGEYELGDALDDLPVEHKIRCFLGAGQKGLQQLVRNYDCDGVRAKADVAFNFGPFAAHWHWHALASSVTEGSPQKIASFLKREVDAILRKDRIGLVCNVEVRRIPTLEDLHRWLAYMYKPLDLLFPVQDYYYQRSEVSRTDVKELLLELGLLRQRLKRTFRMKRRPHLPETGKHTYRLQRSFAAGTHRFGKGTILYESRKDRQRRLADRQGKRKRRSGKTTPTRSRSIR